MAYHVTIQRIYVSGEQSSAEGGLLTFSRSFGALVSLCKIDFKK